MSRWSRSQTSLMSPTLARRAARVHVFVCSPCRPDGDLSGLCKRTADEPRTMVSMSTAPVTEFIAVTIDTPDASALAAFYGALTGGEVTDYPEHGVASVEALGSTLYFQTVADYTRPDWPSQQRP